MRNAMVASTLMDKSCEFSVWRFFMINSNKLLGAFGGSGLVYGFGLTRFLLSDYRPSVEGFRVELSFANPQTSSLTTQPQASTINTTLDLKWIDGRSTIVHQKPLQAEALRVLCRVNKSIATHAPQSTYIANIHSFPSMIPRLSLFSGPAIDVVRRGCTCFHRFLFPPRVLNIRLLHETKRKLFENSADLASKHGRRWGTLLPIFLDSKWKF